MSKCKFGIVNLHSQLANATGGQASVTSARSSTVKPGEEEDVWSAVEIGETLQKKNVFLIN